MTNLIRITHKNIFTSNSWNGSHQTIIGIALFWLHIKWNYKNGISINFGNLNSTENSFTSWQNYLLLKKSEQICKSYIPYEKLLVKPTFLFPIVVWVIQECCIYSCLNKDVSSFSFCCNCTLCRFQIVLYHLFQYQL